MIWAAAQCAVDDSAVPPPELTLYWQMKQYNALPRSGGLDDQPAGLLNRMTAAANAYRAWGSLNSAPRKATWQKENPELWKICKTIFRLREQYG